MVKHIIFSTDVLSNGVPATNPFTLNLASILGVSGYTKFLIKVISATIGGGVSANDNMLLMLSTPSPANNVSATGVITNGTLPLIDSGAGFILPTPSPWYEIAGSSVVFTYIYDNLTVSSAATNSGCIQAEIFAFK